MWAGLLQVSERVWYGGFKYSSTDGCSLDLGCMLGQHCSSHAGQELRIIKETLFGFVPSVPRRCAGKTPESPKSGWPAGQGFG